MRLSHVRLLTDEYPPMFHFYRDAVGLRVRWGDERGPYADLDSGSGIHIALFSRAAIAGMVGTSDLPADAAAQDRAMLIFAVDDVDQQADRLVEHGAVLVNPAADQPDHGIRSAHLRDPDDNLIEINSELPEDRWSDRLRRLNREVNREALP